MDIALIVLRDCLAYAVLALAMFCSAEVGKFFSIATLGGAFCGAAVAAVLAGVIPPMPALFLAALITGSGSALACALLHDAGGLDRLTSGLVAYFMLNAAGLLLAGTGLVRAPLSWERPSMIVAVGLLGATLAGAVIVIGAYMATIRGLKVAAFSNRPELAGRFGYGERFVYLPALWFGEVLAAAAGAIQLYTSGSVELTYAFQPVLVGLTAASLVQFGLRRLSLPARVATVIALIALWRLVFFGMLVALQSWFSSETIANAKEAGIAIIVALAAIAIVKLRSRADARVGGANAR